MAHTTFPSSIPKPIDDGACNHLPGTKFPSLSLPSTSGSSTDIATLTGLTILFCYPRTAAPNETVPDEWNQIPGARGCTPQACSFRDLSKELLEAGVSNVFGCSVQDTEYHRELKERTRLPYELLSDEEGDLKKALKLPEMEWEGKKLIKRLSMVVEDGVILKVFYPVFPPDRSAGEVLEWLQNEYQGRKTLSTEVENETMRNLQKR
ncbi:Peroxiredoxin Q, chloroplastic [Pseudocercospora fuligena]|uniref:Peroxiredoxin Q, chloroplastic n=1 Tax=Pseudocercospora fuligena TaxID=685502 RepID=A0A8H6RHR4_9PEZI|nr:Peroxiredoxin Q, chloroplastic [Pseudocercospora fuligena]